jgi:phosphatidylinositol 3-kinase
VECGPGNSNSPEAAKIYSTFLEVLKNRLTKAQAISTLALIERQQVVYESLCEISKELRDSGLGLQQKKELLRKRLKEHETLARTLDPKKNKGKCFNLPLSLRKPLEGLNPEEARLFSSAMEPMCLTFIESKTNLPYRVIFKRGDDLRQDQLIVSQIL